MKLTLFIIALLSIATFTNAETFLSAKQRKHSTPHLALTPEAFVANLKQTDFGKTILNLVSLQFKTSGRLDDVVSLLGNLQTKLQAQQADDDQNYAQTTASNNQIIADQSAIVETASANIVAYQQQLSDARSSLSQLQVTQQQLETERDSINSAIASNTAIRQSEADAFAQRLETSELISRGIQKTLVLFQQATANGEFNADQVDQLVNLLKSLQAAYSASIAQDQAQEDQAVQTFQDYINERNARLGEIADLLSSIALEISSLEALVAQLQDAISTQVVTRDNAQALKDRTVQAQQDLDSRYNNNKVVRANQLQLLASAVTTLTSNSANVQNYLNQA